MLMHVVFVPGAGEGPASVRASVCWCLVAIFFVVFDLEAVFLYPWAGAARELGWTAYCEIVLFVDLVMACLIYLCKAGVLDWAGRTSATRLRPGPGDRAGFLIQIIKER